MKTVVLPNRDITEEDAAISLSMLKLLNAEPLTLITRQGLQPVGQCYRNVDAVIQEYGRGRRVMGWMLTLLPGVWVQAMHHAIWNVDERRDLDVTEGAKNLPSFGTTAFVPDNSLTPGGAHPRFIENRYLILVDDQLVFDTLEAYRLNNWLVSIQDETVRLKELLDQSFSRYQELRLKVRDKYFPGWCYQEATRDGRFI